MPEQLQRAWRRRKPRWTTELELVTQMREPWRRLHSESSGGRRGAANKGRLEQPGSGLNSWNSGWRVEIKAPPPAAGAGSRQPFALCVARSSDCCIIEPSPFMYFKILIIILRK